MQIKDHGDWVPYKPNPFPPEAPKNAMFCSNYSGADWYKYSRSMITDPDSIKMTILMGEDGKAPTGQVMAANKDVSFLFPQHMKVIEVFGVASADPQREYGGKVYDTRTQIFSDPEPLPGLVETIHPAPVIVDQLPMGVKVAKI